MGQVRYHMQRVEELPPDTGSSKARYRTLLQPIVDDPGNWYHVATYASATGASVVKRKMEKGEIALPALGKWEFESRIVAEGEARSSQLYARYMGS